MLWADFYDGLWEWSDSTKRTRISSLEDIGSGAEVVEAVLEIQDPKVKAQLIRKAMKLGATFTSDDFLELDGELPEELYEQLAQYTGFDHNDPYFDEDNMAWEDFYYSYWDWSEEILTRRIGKLHQFGDSQEVCEAILNMPSEETELLLYKKALSAGVRFSPSDKEELADLTKLLLRRSGSSSPGAAATQFRTGASAAATEHPSAAQTKAPGFWERVTSFFSGNTESCGSGTSSAGYPEEWPVSLRMAQAKQHLDMLLDSVSLISKTVSCRTFFYRYGFALENAQTIVSLSKGLSSEETAQQMLDSLVAEKANIVNDFLFRCHEAGKMQYVRQDIFPYMQDVPPKSRELLHAMLAQEDLTARKEKPHSCDWLFSMLSQTELLSELDAYDLFEGQCGEDFTWTERTDPGRQRKRSRVWNWLFAGILIKELFSLLGSDSKPSHRCDGNCDNCPPHYGYRYGRWYYGHGHQGGCERGGNGGASGRTYRD